MQKNEYTQSYGQLVDEVSFDRKSFNQENWKFLSKKEKKREKGVSIVEIVIYMIIIGVVASMAFAKYSEYQSSQKVSNTQQQVSNLVGKIQSTYRGQGDFDGVSSTMAIDAGLVPKNQIDSAGTGIKNQWNDSIVLKGVKPSGSGAWPSATGNDAQYLEVVINGVDRNECGKLVGTLADSALRVEVNDTAVKDETTSSKLKMSTVASKCKSGGDNNKIAFIYGRA